MTTIINFDAGSDPADMTRAQAASLAKRLRDMASEAKQRGDVARSPRALPPAYWYGVQDGLQQAAARLEALAQGTKK